MPVQFYSDVPLPFRICIGRSFLESHFSVAACVSRSGSGSEITVLFCYTLRAKLGHAFYLVDFMELAFELSVKGSLKMRPSVPKQNKPTSLSDVKSFEISDER